MKASTSTEPTTPVIWDLAPASTATGVLDVLPEMGNPPSRPVAALAAPSAAISLLPETFLPSLAANVWDRTPVSAKAMRAIPAAAGSRVSASAQPMPPSAGIGRPCGRTPVTLTSSLRLQTAVATHEPTTASSTPGTFHFSSRGIQISASEPTPSSNAVMLTSPPSTPVVTFASFCQMSPSASIPRNAGSCDNATNNAIPFRYPSLMGLESSPVMVPSLRPNRPTSVPPRSALPGALPMPPTFRCYPLPAARLPRQSWGGEEESGGPRTRMREGPTNA